MQINGMMVQANDVDQLKWSMPQKVQQSQMERNQIPDAPAMTTYPIIAATGRV